MLTRAMSEKTDVAGGPNSGVRCGLGLVWEAVSAVDLAVVLKEVWVMTLAEVVSWWGLREFWRGREGSFFYGNVGNVKKMNRFRVS